MNRLGPAATCAVAHLLCVLICVHGLGWPCASRTVLAGPECGGHHRKCFRVALGSQPHSYTEGSPRALAVRHPARVHERQHLRERANVHPVPLPGRQSEVARGLPAFLPACPQQAQGCRRD